MRRFRVPVFSHKIFIRPQGATRGGASVWASRRDKIGQDGKPKTIFTIRKLANNVAANCEVVDGTGEVFDAFAALQKGGPEHGVQRYLEIHTTCRA